MSILSKKWLFAVACFPVAVLSTNVSAATCAGTSSTVRACVTPPSTTPGSSVGVSGCVNVGSKCVLPYNAAVPVPSGVNLGSVTVTCGVDGSDPDCLPLNIINE